MTNFKIFLFIFLHFIVTYAKISDLRKCANEDCSEPVSYARTILKYASDDSRILSFPSNVPVKIFSKEAGTRLDLWGAEINGKRGYIPIKFVRETKVLKSNLPFLQFTEGQDDPTIALTSTISTENPNSEPASEPTPSPAEAPVEDKISPNAVTSPYEIIDGTTIFLPPDDNSSPEYSSTPSNVDSSKVEPPKNSPDTKIETETITLDPKLIINNLDSQKKSEIEFKKGEENTISNEENSEDEDDYDLEDEEGSTGDEDENEEEEDVETSTELSITAEKDVSATKNVPESVNTPVVDSSKSAVKETNESNRVFENIPESVNILVVNSSNSDVKETIENNPASVISSREPVQEKVDQLNDSKPIEAVQVKPVTETQTESSQPLVAEPKSEQLNGSNEEEKQEIVKEINGVPSDLPNPLNLFRQPLKEEKDEPKIDASQIQVPENLLPLNNENQPSSPPEVEQIIPTTQATIDEVTPPVDHYKETFIENPIIINNEQIQSDSITEKLEISPEEEIIEQTETKVVEVIERNENIFENSSEHPRKEITGEKIEEKEINYDKAEEPTFIDAVGAKYNSLVAEEIPQNIDNNLDQSIENVSDSFEEIPIAEKVTTEQANEQAIVEDVADNTAEEEPGFLSKMYNSVFGSGDEQVAPKEERISDNENVKSSEIVEEIIEKPAEQIKVCESMWGSHREEKPVEKYLPPQSEPEIPNQSDMQSCSSSDNPTQCGIQNQNDYVKNENIVSNDELSWSFEVPENAYNMFLYLSLTAVTVLLFSLGFYYIEKKRKDSTLIASINTLEKKLLISTKECLLIQDELKTTKERLVSIEDSSFGSNEMVTSLKDELEEAKVTKIELEEQVSNLEKELENATEAGMELNKMLREILTSQSGNVHMMQNVEQLQKQLNEQQETINSMKTTLGVKNTENELLLTELSVTNEKNAQLQEELDKMVVNLLLVQEEKNNIENKLEDQNEKMKLEYEATTKQINYELNVLKEDNSKLKQRIDDTQRVLDLKNNEYNLLKQGMKEIQAAQSNKDSIMALLDVSHVKAEVQQLRDEKHKMTEKLQKEIDNKSVFEKEVQVMIQEVKILKDKFEEAEKEKVEAQTRLEVLSSYFKDKEAQLQKEINENESKFMQKEGEATSTIERIKWIQEELQNYKAQNELLKKEVLDQEVSLKSQISMLEKKSHDNWLLARQAERRLEESKQDASQLRNRLTIVEKNLNNSTHMTDESKLSNRIMSPLESNGEIPVSPLHMNQVDAPGSPPLLFPHRDHMTTSPPIPGMPPFMPPPPGAFMPPPIPGVPPFMPPPPALFPGDHRLPPLGRMSSPPLHGRYSPDSRAYSPYDRDESPPLSPSYPDSDYRRRSPPPTSHMQRTYSPYSGKSTRPPPHWERDEDRDYRAPQRNKPRTHKGLSSGSGNSNESLDNSGRHSGRV